VPPPEPDIVPPNDEVVDPPALGVLPPAAAPPLPDFPPLLTLPPVAAVGVVFPLQATENPMTLRTRKIAVCLVIIFIDQAPWHFGSKIVSVSSVSASKRRSFACRPL
jgi:hypothetical protein